MSEGTSLDLEEWKPVFWRTPHQTEMVVRDKEGDFPKPEGAIVGTTFLPEYVSPENRDMGSPPISDNVRGDLVRRSIDVMKQMKLDIFIVDGGSSDQFIKTSGLYTGIRGASRREYIENQDLPGYSAGREQALRASLATKDHYPTGRWDYVVQMEPEKLPLMTSIQKMSEPILKGEADLVIPDRGIRVKELGDEVDDFRGYPPVQAISERRGNLEIHKILVESGLRKEDEPILDMFGGTRMIAHDQYLLRFFGEHTLVPEKSEWKGKIVPEKYLNAVYTPVLLALAGGYRVASVPVEYVHPQEQSSLETGNSSFDTKRQTQFIDIVSGLKLMGKYLQERKKTTEFSADEYLGWLKKKDPDMDHLHWAKQKNRIETPWHVNEWDYNLRPGGNYDPETLYHPRRVWPVEAFSSE